MRVVRRPTSFEAAWVHTPSGARELVVVMVVGNRRHVGTPSRDEARALRRHLGELLNNEHRVVPTGPSKRRIFG